MTVLRPRKEISIFGALFGLILSPYETTEILFTLPRPRYTFRFLLLIYLAVFAPFLSLMLDPRSVAFEHRVVHATIFVTVMALLVFVFLEAILLRFLKIPATPQKVLAAISYALVPFALAFVLIYFFNFLSAGEVSIVHKLLTDGKLPTDTKFLRIVPYAVTIAELTALVVFSYSIRAMGDMEGYSSWVITLLSFAPLYGAIQAAYYFAQFLPEGAAAIFGSLLRAPFSIVKF